MLHEPKPASSSLNLFAMMATPCTSLCAAVRQQQLQPISVVTKRTPLQAAASLGGLCNARIALLCRRQLLQRRLVSGTPAAAAGRARRAAAAAATARSLAPDPTCPARSPILIMLRPVFRPCAGPAHSSSRSSRSSRRCRPQQQQQWW
jgi:hypothetical protein